MKPADLFDAMDGISEKYITETELAVEQHRINCDAKQQKADPAASVTDKNGSAVGETEHPQTKIRKNSTGTAAKQPVWQRMTTGIVAAAACAVFVGGGWFIAQQAKQTHTGSASSLTEAGERNFLGGTGEIHVAVSKGAPNHGLELMYDDTKVYFQGGKYAADRSGSIVSKAYLTTPDVQETLSHTLYDGEQFYYQDGNSLYLMDNAGNKQAEPFYEISADFIASTQNLPDDIYIPEGNSMTPEIRIGDLQKLRDNEYVIDYAANIYENGEAIWTTGGRELYRPLESDPSRQREIAPGIGNNVLVRDDIAIAQAISYGRFLRWDPNLPTGIPTSVIHQAMAESFSSMLITLGDGEMTKPVEYGTAWTVHDNSIYYMTEIVSDNVNYEPSHYASLDIYTGDFTDMGKAEFTNFLPLDDEILYVTRDGKGFYRSDYDLKAPELLFSDDDSVPAEIREIISQKWNAAPLKSLDGADDNYALITLDCASETDAAFALFDRSSGEMRYFTADRTAAEPV
ncbi:MAG: hypothetical protein J6Z40_08960 [Oscillospiraceae bacterium]|nr:hypothetical protein [Oscillospiraceae bacterium]